MAKRRAQRRDAMDSIIESALQPGRFIGWNEGSSFVAELRQLEGEVVNVVNADPARGVVLYETFIAGCTLKAEEVDDSNGEFGTFAGSLFLRLDSGPPSSGLRSRRDKQSAARLDG